MGSLTSRRSTPAVPHAQLALDALRRIVQALRTSSAHAQHDTGLSGAQLFVLRQLEASALSINALAERTHTHQSSVSAVVQRLAEAGLVERRAPANDRRKVEAVLTPRGRARMRRSPTVAQDALVAALDALSAKARAGLAEGLNQLSDGMGLAPSAPMFFEEPARHAQVAAAPKNVPAPSASSSISKRTPAAARSSRRRG